MAEFIKVSRTSEIPSGTGKAVDVNGQQIALFNVAGTFYATSNTCPHRGGPLAEGDLDSESITCPWHGWSFKLSDGCAAYQAASVKTYPVQLQGDDVLVGI